MIYRGFITANSPRTATADAEEKTLSGGKEERGRERERERAREREKERERSVRHAPDFSSFTRLIS